MCFLQVLNITLVVIVIIWSGIVIRINSTCSTYKPKSGRVEATNPLENSMKKLPPNDMFKCELPGLPSYESALKKPPPLSS